jgi:hypothetical protein
MTQVSISWRDIHCPVDEIGLKSQLVNQNLKGLALT